MNVVVHRGAIGRTMIALLLGLALAGLAPSEPAGAVIVGCNRIQVVSRDRGVTLSQYVVEEQDYVARMRAEIERNGLDGSWQVAAGLLGQAGYTVTYTCLS